MDDHYRTLAAPSEARLKIERSDFLALAFPCTSEIAFQQELIRLQKEHFDATHLCWAVRLRSLARSSDAGEPSGTAGKPILIAIESREVADAAVVVVRWYGGVKLGTGGLSRAYRGAATAALEQAEIIDRYLYESVEVRAPFEALGTIYRLIEPPHVLLIGEEFGEPNTFRFHVRQSRIRAFESTLTERRLSFSRAGESG